MVNAGRDALASPSLTLITIPKELPTSAAAGVPLSWPVEELKLAKLGLPTMLNVNVLPELAAAVGVNEYALPTSVPPLGVPEMVGAEVTVMAKAGSEALDVPSET